MRTRIRISHALVALLVASFAFHATATAQEAASKTRQADRTIEVEILGMSCPFCAYGVEQKLKKLDGVENLEVELKTGIATLSLVTGADVPNETLERAVEDAGFKVAAIRRSFESEFPDVGEESDDG